MEWIPIVHKRLDNLNKLYGKYWVDVQEKWSEALTPPPALTGSETSVSHNNVTEKAENTVNTVNTEPQKNFGMSGTKKAKNPEILKSTSPPKAVVEETKQLRKVIYLICLVSQQRMMLLSFLKALQEDGQHPQMMYHTFSSMPVGQRFSDLCHATRIEDEEGDNVECAEDIHVVHFNNSCREQAEQFLANLTDQKINKPIIVIGSQHTAPDLNKDIVIAHADLTKSKLNYLQQSAEYGLKTDTNNPTLLYSCPKQFGNHHSGIISLLKFHTDASII